ncbi:Bug family tripartite tricarboxylate transporter substrate binding protein [Streptomyces sp. 8N616]|uniref:Bug family tripartite tricarboxylate transporter substrate binding protein n=1 Tax=Streptomyces sp. 8N616 TaxID=3457414 RepID=UPI003FCF9223
MEGSRRRRRRFGSATAAVALATVLAACSQQGGDAAGSKSADGYPERNIEIMVPAAPGGGWDLTARSMQKVLRDDKVVDRAVEVFNVPGAGGTIGLSQFTGKSKGDPHQLMATGLVMIGAIEQSSSPVNLGAVTPIATLTAEAEAIVVPASSKYRTLKDLMTDFRKDPKSVTWGGGSVGGTDHIIAGLLAKAAGVDPSKVKYAGYAGGGEATAAILSGEIDAGISGVSEFEEQVSAGKMRILATSGAEPVEVAGRPAPTITGEGFDVELMNWRAIVAPPGISDAERTAVTEVIDTMHKTPGWQRVLEQQGWDDYYHTGDEAETIFKDETTRVKGIIKDLGVTT